MGGAAATARIHAVPRRHRAVPDVVYRHRDQLVADDRAVSLHAVAGGLVGEHAGFSSDRHALPAADHPDVHRLVVLGIPRQSPRHCRLSLSLGYEAVQRDPDRITTKLLRGMSLLLA